MAHTHKVGRGGAGNYHSAPEDRRRPSPPTGTDAASTIPRQDSTQDAVAAVTRPEAPGPVRGGRGGAGNFCDPADLPDAHDAARDVGAAVASSRYRQQQQAARDKGRRAMGGRGGAGNWVEGDGIDEEKYNDYDEWDEPDGGPRGRKLEELERRVQEVVDKGLRIPDKVHHGTDRGGGHG